MNMYKHYDVHKHSPKEVFMRELWYLEVDVIISGEDVIGEPFETGLPIMAPITAATNPEQAKLQASAIASMLASPSFLQKFCSSYDSENAVKFGTPRLVHIEELEIRIPDIIGGP